MTTNPVEPGINEPDALPEADPDEVLPESPGVDPDWPQTAEPAPSP
jgi:hypothetical protein